LATENHAASFFSMSSVGFTHQSKDDELEKLREAWRSLNDVLRNLRNAEAAVIIRDLNLIAAHLQVAKWNVEQVKKAIAFVGQSKNQKGRHLGRPFRLQG
jgi:hypothetical protein